VDLVGVFANADREHINQVLRVANLTAIQLHGKESPEFCERIKELFPQLELIKAFAIRNQGDLSGTHDYTKVVDTLLLDAYHPQLLGGTGDTLPWDELVQFTPALPWLLAGGLKPNNVAEALGQLRPDGIDLSSGVERSPGDKNLELVNQLFTVLNQL
jgi:phosphoribosylanthranilate isomerase